MGASGLNHIKLGKTVENHCQMMGSNDDPFTLLPLTPLTTKALHCHLTFPALCQILSDLHELIADWVSAIELWVT